MGENTFVSYVPFVPSPKKNSLWGLTALVFGVMLFSMLGFWFIVTGYLQKECV